MGNGKIKSPYGTSEIRIVCQCGGVSTWECRRTFHNGRRTKIIHKTVKHHSSLVIQKLRQDNETAYEKVMVNLQY